MRWEDYRVEVRQEDYRGEASREYARGEMRREDDTGDRRWDIDRGEVRLEVDRARGRRQESATGVMRWEDVGGVGQEYCRREVRREDVRGEMRRKDGRGEMMRWEDRREARLEDEKGRERNYRDCLQEAECLSVPLKSKRKIHKSENFNECRQKMSKEVCKFYSKGKCGKGDRCKYRHGGVPLRKKKPCKYDAQGSCDAGERCIYIHDILDRRNVAHEMPRRFSHSEETTAKIIGLLQGVHFSNIYMILQYVCLLLS
uniref:C3H1-type domain-containing protein n=1 Tax=Eptatretus burgeri TaxID=7764 RepID=A0A8C4Q2U4_EPTBU